MTPGYLVETIIREEITAVHFIPSLSRIFLEQGAERCHSLRLLTSSGEALPLDGQQRCQALLKTTTISNLYGPTAAVDVTFQVSAQ